MHIAHWYRVKMRACKLFYTYIILSYIANGSVVNALPSNCKINIARKLLEKIRVELKIKVFDSCLLNKNKLIETLYSSRTGRAFKIVYDIPDMADTITNTSRWRFGSVFLFYPITSISIDDTIRDFCYGNVSKETCSSFLTYRFYLDLIFKIANHYKGEASNCEEFLGYIGKEVSYLQKIFNSSFHDENIMKQCSRHLEYPSLRIHQQDHVSQHLAYHTIFQLLQELRDTSP